MLYGILVMALVAVAAHAQVTITSIQPTYGSIAGGTRLKIYGNGFSMDKYTGGNVVYVGRYPCTVINHLTSDTVVTCETTAASGPSSQQVTVLVDGTNTTSYCCYNYHRDYTPTLQAIQPAAAAPGGTAVLYGRGSWVMQQDCSADGLDPDSETCVGAILIGDYICQAEANALTYGSQSRFGSSYQLNCTLPTPQSSRSAPATVDPQRGLGVAGSYNVTIHFEGRLAGGAALSRMSSYETDAAGNPYQFQIYPEIKSVTPAAGSLAGGSVLSIQGSGFPDTSMPSNNTVNVGAGGVPCDVISSNFTLLQCRTRPQAAGWTAPAPIKGLYPGMRGIQYDFLNKTVGGTSQLWMINNWSLGVDANGSSSVLTSSWEGPDFYTPYYCSRSKAFFTAPVTGDYTFLATVDDYAQLNATYLNPADQSAAPISVTLITSGGTGGADQWPGASSAPLSLSAGQALLLEAGHCNGAVYGTLQVGVLIPSNTTKWNSVSEKQRIDLTNSFASRQLTIRYMYPAANDSAFNITISGSNLTNALVGVNVTVNTKTVAPFVLGATPSTLVNLLATALQLTNMDVGVEQFISSDNSTVVLQVAVDATKAGNVTLTAVATAVPYVAPVLPPAPPDANATCVYSAPVWIPGPDSTVNQTVYVESFPPQPRYPNPPAAAAPAPAAVDLSTVTVEVTAVSVVVSATKPKWRLWGTDTYNDTVLEYNASIDDVTKALYAPWQIYDEKRTSLRIGAKLGYQWTFLYHGAYQNNVGPVNVEILDGINPAIRNPFGPFVETDIRNASTLLNGTFTLAIGGYCDTVNVSVLESEEIWQQKINSLPGVNGVEVSKGHDLYYSHSALISFTSSAGDVPALRVVTNKLTGSSPTVAVTTVRNGSTDQLFGPIPAEMTQIPVTYPDSIQVVVNKVPAACASGAACRFSHSAGLTPSVTSVTPVDALKPDVGTTQTLTITGEGFSRVASENVIAIGPYACTNVAVTVNSPSDATAATQLTCQIGADVISGVRKVSVTVAGKGLATGSFSVTLRTLDITSVTPAASVAANGYTLITVTGRGFDYLNCERNWVTLADVRCGVLACSKNELKVIFPGAAPTATANLTVAVQNEDGTFDALGGSSHSLEVSASGNRISDLLSSQKLSAAGGTVRFSIDGSTEFNTSNLNTWRISLIPAFDTNFSVAGTHKAINSSFGTKLPCHVPTAENDTLVNCTTGKVPPGRYFLLLETGAATYLYAAQPIQSVLSISSVTPSTGSIGGGTSLTLTGFGFQTEPDANVVVISVPVSTTFLNGITLCDVTSVNDTVLTCVTRAHLAADASADDPNAVDVMPRATQPGDVQVVLCQSGLSDVLKLYCWDDRSPRTSCDNGDPSACKFSYAWGITPNIISISPRTGAAATALSIVGNIFDNVDAVWLNARWGSAACPTTGQNATMINCTVPTLPSGTYQVVLQKLSGEIGIDPFGAGTFYYAPNITGISGFTGSNAGGGLLTLTTSAAGFNDTNPNANVVLIGRQACTVVPPVTPTSLTCRAPRLNGLVLAEYWRLPYGTWDLPDMRGFVKPDLVTYEPVLDFNWQWGNPAGLGAVDFFAARYSFTLQVPATGNYSFNLNADDIARMYIDKEWVGINRGGQQPTVMLQKGYHAVQIEYMEWTGYSSFNLRWNAGIANGAMVVVPSELMYLAAPGTGIPIQAAVNGAPASMTCGSATANLPTAAAAGTVDANELSSITTPAGTCVYVYSSWVTPVITSFSSLTVGDTSSGSVNLTLSGTRLTDVTSDYSVTVGGVTCPVIEADAGVSGVNGSVTCTLPSMSAGAQELRVMVAGRGSAQLPNGKVVTNLTYAMAITSLSPSSGAFWGGSLITINGYGFVQYSDGNSTAAGRSMSLAITGEPGVAVLTILNSTTHQAIVRLERYRGSSNSATTATTITMTNNGPATGLPKPSATATYTLSKALTPSISAVSPTTLAPYTSATLTLTWQISVGNATLAATSAGNASLATVDLQASTATAISCSDPTISSSQLDASKYVETLTCSVPDSLPAANYTAWVCMAPYGCGLGGDVAINLTVSAMSPAAGSAAGGHKLMITGSGFSSTISQVLVRFNTTPCAVTFSNATVVMCTTSAAKSGYGAYPAYITPSQGATEQLFQGVTYTYDAALTPVITGITPTRGSTEGGTNVTVTGTFPTDPAITLSVFIGSTACTSITLIDAHTINCLTGNPGTPKPAGPQLVSVQFSDRGNSVNTGGNITFQCVDLWSRRSSWGGEDPPSEGDSVVIPAGHTMLLDVSPPKLYAIVLEGNLMFDDTAPELHLQANYILVKGGNLSIGTVDTPFPGLAKITLHGPYNSRELPIYGAKVLAVREGNVIMHGQHKTPTWTQLNATANVGDTSIVLNGHVNWVVGDRIVIAASSFYATEVDEVTITAVTSLDNGNTRLTLASPLAFTHLGEVVTVPEDPLKMVLDMRAEVAVLNRTVQFFGDETSPEWMYGAHILVNTPMRKKTGRSNITLTHVEVKYGGQAFRLGRYPIHWHMHGDNFFGSKVEGCSIHHSFQRAVTVHGTHRVTLKDNVAYDIMGHTYFFEDGVEWGSVWENNLGILTRVTNAMLNTDTSPSTFWVTNPNNTLIGNRAAGSAAYGFWYRMLSNPEGPSFTYSSCPKFTPLGLFKDNVAHSNMFYGLRVFPEYYPKLDPCSGSYNQVPAVFDGLISYKNGMKCAIATQVGIVQFRNFTVADCGGGPKQHIVNGKDHGGHIEFAWVLDDRNRYNTELTAMAGIQNALIISRTEVGKQGTAGDWPSGRGVRGVLTQSPPLGEDKHSALMSVINVTFVNFTAEPFYALENCAKCKPLQGGATTFMKNLKFVQPSSSRPRLATWTWGHQGIFLDTDGTLINPSTIDPAFYPANWPFGPGITYHSAVESQLFDPAECVYMGNGAICRPELTFRRIMLHGHAPPALKYRDLLVTSDITNRTSRVHFTNYNEDGYQWTVATMRNYWLHWDTPFGLDPSEYSLHKMDLMNETHGWVYLNTKYIQVNDHVKVNGKTASGLLALPDPTSAKHGALFYNKTKAPLGWWYGNETHNVTRSTVFLDGPSDGRLNIDMNECPDSGCPLTPAKPADWRNGTLKWSDPATWLNFPNGKPKAGDNVTIPLGWNLVIDENPPPLLLFTIEGNVTFDNSSDITLTATYILVAATGHLWAGLSPDQPHPTKATISLTGSRATPQIAITNDLNLGARFLAAINGGRITLHGNPVNERWTRLAQTAVAGTSQLVLAHGNVGWSVGQKILVTSTTFNQLQTEIRTITGITGSVIQLDTPLKYTHTATLASFPGSSYMLDSRAEVAMLDTNLNILPDDGDLQYTPGNGKFGPRVIVHGQSTARLANIGMSYCGQAGLMRGCVQFEKLVGQEHGSNYLVNSSLHHNMDAGLRITGGASSEGVLVAGNVMHESYDVSTLIVASGNNAIIDNLVTGTIKEMTGKSEKDKQMTSCFEIIENNINNTIRGNIAAGSERLGFWLAGDSCDQSPALFSNNTAHSCLAGMLLIANSRGAACTKVTNFTTYLNWDFGIITMKGIETHVTLQDVVVADTKHVGVLILKKGAMTQPADVKWNGGLVVGQSSPDVCTMCARRASMDLSNADPGCHPKLSSKSFNKRSPFDASIGLQSSVFGIEFTVGPEHKPWDEIHGYHTIQGNMRVSGVTFANFPGAGVCGQGSFAIGNHHFAPDAFHPHFFSKINRVAVADDALFWMVPPDPEWRNEADCGEATYNPPDGSVIPLNCAGPKHVYYRDLDGSLIGRVGTVLGDFVAQRHSSLYDQGTGVLPGPCIYHPPFQAYICTPGATATTLASGWSPDPMPAAGIFGDPQLFVLESRDSDTEDRNFSPVFMESGGVRDLAITAMDQGWCFGYTCQKRLSTFWMVAATGHTMNINFTGTPSKVLRLWLPYADPRSETIFVINMLQIPNRRFVWTETDLRIDASNSPPTVGDGTGHGAYHWDQNTTTLWVKMKGGQSLEIRTENAIQVSQTLAVSIDAFFETQTKFLQNLAFVLGIEMTRIKIMKVVPGSVVLDYLIIEDPKIANQPIAEPVFDTSRNVDPLTQALLKTMPADQQAAFMAAYATTTAPPATAPNSQPSNYASTELTQVLATMQASVASGSMEKQIGMQILSMNVKVMLAAEPAGSNTNTNTNTTLSYNIDLMPPASSSKGGLNIIAIVVPTVVGVAVIALLSLFTVKAYQARTVRVGPQQIPPLGVRQFLTSMSRKLMPARSFTRLDISDADDDVTARAASTAIYEQQKFLAAASSFHSGLAHSGSGNSGSPSPSESTPKSGSSLTAGTPAATVATPFLASGATASAAGPHPLMGDIFDKGVMGSKTKQLPPLQTGNLVKHKPELISPGPPEDKADNQPGIFRKLTWTGR